VAEQKLNWSVSLAGIPLPFGEALDWVAANGFTDVELFGTSGFTQLSREQLADSGLFVSSVVLPFPVTADAAIDRSSDNAYWAWRDYLDAAAQIGAHGIILDAEPRHDAESTARFAESCESLALEAATRFLTFCVLNGEPIPDPNSLIGESWDVAIGEPQPPYFDLVHVRLKLAENPDQESVAAVRHLRSLDYRGPVVLATSCDWRLLPQMLSRLGKAAFIDLSPQ
jgi:hypothetical protein